MKTQLSRVLLYNRRPPPMPTDTITPDQHRVLALLAEGKSIAAAAESVGIHRNTVRNWRRTYPSFAREAALAVREQATAWHEQAVTLAPKATAVLEDALANPATPLTQRVRVALAILKMAATPQPSRTEPTDPIVPEPDPIPAELAPDSLSAPTPELPGFVHKQTAQKCTIVHNAVAQRTPPRNGPCLCGSGIKYKKCCGNPAVSFVVPAAA